MPWSTTCMIIHDRLTPETHYFAACRTLACALPGTLVAQGDLVGLGDVVGLDGPESCAQALAGLPQQLEGVGGGALRGGTLRISPVFLDEVGLQGCGDFVGRLQRVVDGPIPCSVVNHRVSIAPPRVSGSPGTHPPDGIMTSCHAARRVVRGPMLPQTAATERPVDPPTWPVRSGGSVKCAVAHDWRAYRSGGSWAGLTDRALAVSPGSMPKEMIRVGRMRTMVSSNRSPTALPPDGITAAVPRTSIIRGCHGGRTSSITMLARPVRCTSRSFLVWLIRMPPTSIASCSALYRNVVGTTCGCPSGPTVAIRPRRCPARYSSSLSVNTLMPG